VQRTALSRIEELVGPSREEALGAEECKGGSFVSTDWRKLEHLSVLHCELVAVGYDAMARLPSLQHLELQVTFLLEGSFLLRRGRRVMCL
jgi:hypothetical protein